MEEIENNIKYQQICEAGKSLFWKFGIKKVSVEEISKTAKVSKVTFYKFFSNKVELAKTIFDNTINLALKQYEELINSDLSFQEKIDTMFRMKLEATENISREFITDIYENPQLGMIEFMEKQGRRSLELTISFIEDSKNKGFISSDISINFVMYFLNKMSEMVNDEALSSKYKNPQDMIMEILSFFFYGVGAKK